MEKLCISNDIHNCTIHDYVPIIKCTHNDQMFGLTFIENDVSEFTISSGLTNTKLRICNNRLVSLNTYTHKETLGGQRYLYCGFMPCIVKASKFH